MNWIQIVVMCINIGGGAFVAFVGVYSVATLQMFRNFDFWRLWNFFTPFILILFGLMLVMVEFKIKFISS